MVSVGDIIEFKDFQTLTNISGDVLNVYHYQVTGLTATTAIADDISSWGALFDAAIMDFVRAIQTNGTVHTRLEINNLMAYATDFGVNVWSPAQTGQVVSDYASSATAWSYQLLRTTRETRHGHKRIAGVPDSWSSNNGPDLSHMPDFGALSTAMATNIVGTVDGGKGITLMPVIIKKPVLVTTPPTVINPVSGALFRGVGSQNSRKQLF